MVEKRKRKEEENEAGISVDHTGRRKWDQTYFALKAAQKQQEDDSSSLPPKKLIALESAERSHLKQRDQELKLEQYIGKQKTFTSTAPIEQQGGFFCDLCECLLKDSATYLDHLNGKKHNRLMGMSMKVKQATRSQVKDRLQALKTKLKQQNQRTTS